MEEDIHDYEFTTNLLEKASVKRQLKALEGAADKAGELIKYESAHNPEIQYALDIIAKFIEIFPQYFFYAQAFNYWYFYY